MTTLTAPALRVEKMITAGRGRQIARAVLQRACELPLAFEMRTKSRFAATLSDGRLANFFLPRGTVLADGDILVAEDGSMIRVSAASQAVITIKSTDTHLLTRAAYHLGNRHIPVQVGKGFLRLEPDTVLEAMLTQLGLEAIHELAPFEPETGAYGGGHRHSHSETFDADYALAQKVYQVHDHDHEH